MTNENGRRTPRPGEDREGWMMFHHAGPLNLFELTAEQIDVRDIIHWLSRINRFNGQSAVPIPVLWHSLLVMQLCAGENRATRLKALFHDAGETYVSDIIRPIRSVMGQPFMRLRESIQGTVFEAVGVTRRLRDPVEAGAPGRRHRDALRDGIPVGLRAGRHLARNAVGSGAKGGSERDRAHRRPATQRNRPRAARRPLPRPRRPADRSGSPDTRFHRQGPEGLSGPPEIDRRNRPGRSGR